MSGGSPRVRGIGRWVLVLASCVTGPAIAGDVEIVEARFAAGSGTTWQVSVTLRHGDSGWEHYADGWRVVGKDGAVLGTRTLYHPHVDEQPFTRGHSVVIPAGSREVFVEAHDLVHGWSPDRLRVDLGTESGERYEVRR